MLFLLLPNAFWLKIEWKTAWSPAANVEQIKLSYRLRFVFVFHYQSSSCGARLVCCLLGINYNYCVTSNSPDSGWFLSRYFKWENSNFEFLLSFPFKMPESELMKLLNNKRTEIIFSRQPSREMKLTLSVITIFI